MERIERERESKSGWQRKGKKERKKEETAALVIQLSRKLFRDNVMQLVQCSISSSSA